MSQWIRRLLALGLGLLLVPMMAASSHAQELPTTLNINTYVCPPDYDRVSDCTKIGGVVVSVVQDGVELGPVTTDAAAGVEIPVQAGVELTAAVVEGQPEGTTLESTVLTFVPEEGLNALTLVFIENAAPSEPAPAPSEPAPVPSEPAPAPSEPTGPIGLPDTGAGSTATGPSLALATWLTLAALLAAVGAWTMTAPRPRLTSAQTVGGTKRRRRIPLRLRRPFP